MDYKPSLKEGFLCEDWNEVLISAIQARPTLYTKSNPDYSDRNKVHQLWNEVCAEIIPDWDDLSIEEQRYKGNDVKTKWQNLRTCFKRELNEQKKQKLGQITKKRRKYIYFHRLSFLLPTFDDHLAPKRVKKATSPIPKYEEVYTESEEPYRSPPRYSKKLKQGSDYEEPMIDIQREARYYEIDEDKFFLLSLVPAFKKMPDDEKIQIKVKFLSLIGDPTLSLVSTIDDPEAQID